MTGCDRRHISSLYACHADMNLLKEAIALTILLLLTSCAPFKVADNNLRGELLRDISKCYRVSVFALKKANPQLYCDVRNRTSQQYPVACCGVVYA